jgi:hypothetical protein
MTNPMRRARSRIGWAIAGTMVGTWLVALPNAACADDSAGANAGAPAVTQPVVPQPVLPPGVTNLPGAAVQPVMDNGGANNGDHYSGDFPHREVMAVPPARANATAARWMHYQAEDNLHDVVDRLNEDYQSSTEMVEALRQEKSAYADYEEARHGVLSKLSSDPSYRAMTHLVAELKDDLEDHRPKGPPTEEETQHIMAVAALKLSYATSITAMEASALAADGHMQQAKARLLGAGQRLADLRAKAKHDLKRDDQFVAARRAMEDSRIAHLAAQAYYESTVEARDIAVNYAYYVHGWDYMRYASGNGYSYPSYPFFPYGNYYAGAFTGYGTGYPYTVVRR